MRLRTAARSTAAATVAAAVPALLALGPAGTASADPAPGPGAAETRDTTNLPPYCGDPDSAGFPVATRVHGGPDTYAPGDGWQSWKVELRNTTGEDCRAVHPVAVFVDERRSLAKDQLRLEFYDDGAGRWRTADVEKTDEDELIGVFEDDGFRGFSVKPDGKLVVPARMRFADGTRDDGVQVTVAAMQHRDDDGDWVGESNTYAFDISGEEGGSDEAGPGESGADGSEQGDPERRSDGPGARPSPGPGAAKAAELARTGRYAALTWLAAAAGACLASGTALLLFARRRLR